LSIRIGIDARAAAEVPAGRGRVARELLRELARRDDAHEYFLYGRSEWNDPTLDERFRWLLVRRPDPLWNVEVGLTAHRESDVFLSLNSYLTAWFTRAPTAVLVHDLIAWEVPESAQSRAARIERATIRPALRRAQRILCYSQSTFADLTRRFPRAATKASVVPLAASPSFGRELGYDRLENTRRKHGLDRPFVLSTGTLEPRKNLVRLIDAFGMLREDVRSAHELVLVGPHGWEYGEITARTGGDVRILGHVTDEDLAALYELCVVFCYPSLYEGFGLPLLEAMQTGAASIASNTSSLPEVGGDAVRYVDPRDTRALASELESLLTDSDARLELGRRARERARTFSWSRTADEILAVLTAVARRGTVA
jgi:glycosyltransferase involved in cell wall biosynthesis